MLFRPTAKLLKLIGKPWSTQLVEAPPSDDDWYGNLLWLDGRKSVLLTHAATLFSIFVPDIAVADLRPPGQFLVSRIEEALATEGLPPWTFGQLDPDTVRLAKTADRVVLVCMNDMASMAENVIVSDGGLGDCDFGELHRILRRNVNSSRNYVRPIDAVRARLTVG